MKKQIIFIISVVITIIAIIIGVSSVHEKDITGISRYEWVQMLVEKFGVNEVSDKSPYFEDVDSNNVYFSCVQSAYEWGIIDNDSPFNGDAVSDGEFVAITAMKAVGKYKVQIYLEKQDEPTNEDYIELAIEEKLIEKNQLEKGISAEEGNKILLQAFELYQHGLWKDDVCNIDYRDGIIEIAKEDIIVLKEDYSEIELSGKYAESIEEGRIIIIEDLNTGEKIARKINHALSEKSYILDDVELEEVIESVMISDIMAVSKDNVISYYELADKKTDYRPLNALNNFNYMPVFFDDWKGENFSIQIPIGEDGVNVQISDLYIGTQILGSLSKGIEYANVQAEADITLSGGFSLEKEETFPIFKTAILLAGGTAKVDIEFYLVLSLDGSVKIEAKIPTQFSVDYKKGTGIRSPKVDFAPEKPEIVADCNAGCFMRTEVVPKLLGVAILDTEADIGVTVSASVTERFGGNVWQCADFAIAYPLITITVSGDDDKKTVLGKLNLSAEWEILSRDNTLVNEDLHCEWYKDGTYKIVDECTYNAGEIDTSEPHEYVAYFNSSFVDKGDYYEVTGKLTDRVYIPMSIVENMSVNEEYIYDGMTFIYKNRGISRDNFVYYDFVDEAGNTYIVDTRSSTGEYYDMETFVDESIKESNYTFVVIENNFKFKFRKDETIDLIMEVIKDEYGGSYGNFETFTIEQIYNEKIKDYEGNVFTETYNIATNVTFDSEGKVIPLCYNAGYGKITFVEVE